MHEVETTTYGFRHVPTGTMVRLNKRENVGGDCCGEHTCSLSLYASDPIFEVDHPRALSRILVGDEQWYNSSDTSPMWGDFRRVDGPRQKHRVYLDDLEPVVIGRFVTYARVGDVDPVMSRMGVVPTTLPKIGPPVEPGRRKLPQGMIGRYFNVEGDLADEGLISVVMFFGDDDPADHVGHYAASRAGDRGVEGQILAVADLPDGYPLESAAIKRVEAGETPHIALLNIWLDRDEKLVITPVDTPTAAPGF